MKIVKKTNRLKTLILNWLWYVTLDMKSLMLCLYLSLFISLSLLQNNALANDKYSVLNQKITNWIDEKAESLDLALSGKKYTDQKQKTRARINQEVFWLDYEGVKYKLDLDLDLSLPNFEEKYKLMLSNYNRNEVRRSTYARREFRREDESNYGAAFAILRKIGKINVSFIPRIEISDPIATFYTLRFERKTQWGRYNFKARLELFADSKKGTGQFLALTFRKDFLQNWSHFLVFEEEYRDVENFYSNLYGYTILLHISDYMSINNSIILTANNQKDQNTGLINFNLNEIFVGPAFTHEVIPNELEYTINYIHVFSEEYNFKGRSSVSFLLGIIF